jgi:hypothetical protein
VSLSGSWFNFHPKEMEIMVDWEIKEKRAT